MELRKDYILDRWVYIATNRSKRPKEFRKEEKLEKEKICFFCPGNEELTPPEIGRVEKNGKWIIEEIKSVANLKDFSHKSQI